MQLSAPTLLAALLASASSCAGFVVVVATKTTILYQFSTGIGGVMPFEQAPIAYIYKCNNLADTDSSDSLARNCQQLGWRAGRGTSAAAYSNGYNTGKNGSGMQVWKNGKYLNCAAQKTRLYRGYNIVSLIEIRSDYTCTYTTWQNPK